MSSFKEFYKELSKRYRPLNEGLIVSYDTQKLKAKLYEILGSKITHFSIKTYSKEKYETKQSKYGTPLLLEVYVRDFNLDDFKNVKNILNVYGYYIANIKDFKINLETKAFKTEPNYLQIEPKYGIVFNPREWNIEYLYHITTKKHLPKILKNGLNPRDTETTFYHPGDRIFLFYSKSNKIISAWKNLLARNKGLSPNEVVILKVKTLPYVTYYIDDSVTLPDPDNIIADQTIQGIIGVYTTKSISPTEISVIGKNT